MKSLIVSDSYSFKSIKSALEKFGIEYKIVNTWDEVPQYLNGEDVFDFIILDDNIVGLILMQMIQRIKKSHPDIKIIVLVNKNSDEFLKSISIDEVYFILQKPYEISELHMVFKKISDELRK